MFHAEMENDPYSTPAANLHGSAGFVSSASVSAAAVQQLAATKPWVRFISVMIFIGAGFMLIGAAGMGIMGSVGVFAGSRSGGLLSGSMGFTLMGLYIVMAAIYVFPGLKLWKYASSIGMLIQTGRDEDLVAALNQQRSFWKFAGIIILAMLVLYVAVIAVMAVFAGISAASMR